MPVGILESSKLARWLADLGFSPCTSLIPTLIKMLRHGPMECGSGMLLILDAFKRQPGIHMPSLPLSAPNTRFCVFESPIITV